MKKHFLGVRIFVGQSEKNNFSGNFQPTSPLPLSTGEGLLAKLEAQNVCWGEVCWKLPEKLFFEKPHSYLSLRRLTFSLLLMSLNVAALFAQTPTLNYVRTRTYQQALAIEPTAPTAEQAHTSITYVDGLGRPIQSVGMEMSPTKKDMIQAVEYDAFGRENKKYLPFTAAGAGKYQPEAVWRADGLTPGGISDFYKPNTDHPDDGNTPKVFAETFFEASPMNRVLKQGSVGNDWTGHEAQMAYTTNTATEVIRYDATGLTLTDIAQSTINSGYYPAGSLMVTEALDENGNKVREYKNRIGQSLLKRVYNGAILMDTYYVYDDLGQLRAVLQPMFQDNTVVLTLLQKLNTYAFLYVYDNRGRMVEKKIPGIDPVYTVYDQWDRVVFSQDGNQRTRNFWAFIRYDFLNRPIITGEKSLTSTRAALQTKADAVAGHEEIRRTTAPAAYGYSLDLMSKNSAGTADPTLNFVMADIYTVTYYDDYTYPSIPTDFAFNNIFALTASDFITFSGVTPDVKSKRKGQATGSLVRILNTTTQVMLMNTPFYDDKYRPIQNYRQLYDVGSGGWERISMKLDFMGKKTQDNNYHKTIANNYQVAKVYTYDHAERLTQTTHQITKNPGAGVAGGEQISPQVTLNQLTYNELGQLKDKKVHVASATDFIERLTYTYNIRGWLLNTTGKSPNASSVEVQNFLVNLNYQDGTAHSLAGSTNTFSPQFNGNIRAMSVTYPSASIDAFEFTYDGANRLTNAERASSTLKEFGIGYDLNGNITALKRNDATAAIDNLTYTYTGNQLLRVTDASSLTAGFVSTTTANTTTSTDYAYDKNGNLTQDLNKGIAANTITYNLINLLNVVTINGKTLNYNYDAAGVKHKMEVKTGSISNAKTQYEGIFEYDANPRVTRIATEEGQVTLTWSGTTYTPQYQYYLSDHLGNTRVVITETKTIVQENAYYPFGLQRPLSPNTVAASIAVNKYLYNGKELQPETNWEDYGFRQYDGAVGRWMVVDALTEKMRGFNPYVYCINNPLRFRDPDGLDIINYNDFVSYTGNDAKTLFKNVKNQLNAGGIKGVHFVYEDGKSGTPEIYKLTLKAFRMGKPNILHFDSDKANQKKRRDQSLLNVPKAPQGYERDEYPYASTAEGGTGAVVGNVPSKEQRRQGGLLRVLYQTLDNGDAFLVVTVPKDKEPEDEKVPSPDTKPILPPLPNRNPEVPGVPAFERLFRAIPFLWLPIYIPENLKPQEKTQEG